MAGFIKLLRSGAWLTAERMRLVAFALLAASLLGAGFLIATSDGFNDRLGRPLGTDFSSFYAAGTLVRDGLPAAAFDLAVHYAREQMIFGSATPYYVFLYPPFFLLIAAALALMGYPLALAVWQGVTFAFYLLSIRAILTASLPSPCGEGRAPKARGVGLTTLKRPPPDPREGEVKREWLLLALAFPAVFVNLGHGQNGFLTTSLLGLALVALDRRPLVAGLLFGLLAYKPQFGLMIPLVLLATGRWRVVAAAAATVAALMLVTLLAFGPAVWHAFFASMPFTRAVLLEQSDLGWHKMQSTFSWVRMWGGPVGLAYLVQGTVTITVAAALAWIWRSEARYPLKAAALLIGTLLATPFCLDYDLMLLAPAIAFLAADGSLRGFAPWEKTILASLWIVPLIARAVAETTLIPLAVPFMLLSFTMLLRRTGIFEALSFRGAAQRRARNP